MNLGELLKSLTNVKPDEEQIKRIEAIREAYKNVAIALFKNCLQSRNMSIAITALEESLHRAIKSIVLEDE